MINDTMVSRYIIHLDHLLHIDKGQLYKRTRARNVMIYRM